MTKPIFIIRIPASAPTDTLGEQMDMISKRLEKGYYVIPIRDSSVDRVEFEYYNVYNAESKDIEEIKQIVLKQFNNEQ